MFCPECGTLGFPNPSGRIKCPSYYCGYYGNAENVIKVGGAFYDVSRVSFCTPSTQPHDLHRLDRFGVRISGVVELSSWLETHSAVNHAFYDEWRDMREGWSYGMTRHDVQNYGSG